LALENVTEGASPDMTHFLSDTKHLPQAKAGLLAAVGKLCCAHVNLHATIVFFSGMFTGITSFMASDFPRMECAIKRTYYCVY
jgi:hypothetical protein